MPRELLPVLDFCHWYWVSVASATGSISHQQQQRDVTRLHHALLLRPENVKAINELDAGLRKAIDMAKAAGLPQGMIVALLHGQAHSETARMVS